MSTLFIDINKKNDKKNDITDLFFGSTKNDKKNESQIVEFELNIKKGNESKKIEKSNDDGLEKAETYNTNKKNRNFKEKVLFWFKGAKKSFGKPLRQILLWYLIITLTGAMLLWAPFTQQDTWTEAVNSGYFSAVSFIDALFVSSSAFSDTGLTPVEISIVYNAFGQAIISFLIIIGGIGWFGIKLFILQFFIRKAVTHKSITTLSKERGYSKIGSTFDVIKVAIIVQFVAILSFGIFIGLTLMYSDPSNPIAFVDFFHENTIHDNGVLYTSTWIDTTQMFEGTHYVYDPTTKEITYTEAGINYIVSGLSPQGNANIAFGSGFFLATSALNNAGFTTIASSSLFAYVLNHELLIMIVFLFILGGIGFPIIYDIKEWIKYRSHEQRFRFSLLSKVSIIWFFGVSVVFWSTSVLFEMSILKDSSEFIVNGGLVDPSQLNGGTYNPNLELPSMNEGFESYSTSNQFAIISFMSMSTRSAGFSTIDVSVLSEGLMFIFMFSMFIGSSPSSTTGGIRNTTLAIIIVSLIGFARGREKTTMFKRTIAKEQVQSAHAILISGFMLVILFSLLVSTSLPPVSDGMSVIEEEYSFMDTFFETFSAFGTTGLSTGITSDLNNFSKVMIIILMFIGQLGLATFIGQFTPKESKIKITNHPIEEI